MMPVTELAPVLEEAGFDSFWTGDHSHIPVTPVADHPVTGKARPPVAQRLLDPFVVLTAAASVTKTLKVGTAVCIVPQRDPIQLAKEVASLDVLSGGRFLFGV